ncbi:MAG: mevalonate kinase [Methanobacteriaceae archaeon]|nr:mevalonate kinase [Methanobacteriaceae archaeon]
MEAKASAPGKVILFGEHAVVYGKPAIAVAVDKRAVIKISENKEDTIKVYIKNLNISATIDQLNNHIIIDNGNPGILKYVLESLKRVHDASPVTIEIDLDIPIGAGFGSSAAVTVATLAAASKYNHKNLTKKEIAQKAHEVELSVQNSASPLDTTISTFGGAVYLAANAEEIKKLELNWTYPLVIGFTPRKEDTGKLVEKVRLRKEAYPDIINPLLDAMGILTETALKFIIEKKYSYLGELMNINHGFLDCLGVNTKELSNMVYTARKTGALGAKITGAGGGGSIVALCPENNLKILSALKNIEDAIEVNISHEGLEFID